jgi:hypothetical protein
MFSEGVMTYLGLINDADISTDAAIGTNTVCDSDNESDEGSEAHTIHLPTSKSAGSARVHSESMIIPLPSSFGIECRRIPAHRTIAQQEIGLRIGQANDALHQIRIALSHKSFLFRTSVRVSHTQWTKSRAWDGVHSADAMLQRHVHTYRRARASLVRLGADEALLSKYQVLRTEDLKVSTAVMDIRLPSRAETTLAWFWNMDIQRDATLDSCMAECRWYYSGKGAITYWTNLVYRVHWLRAKAKFDRAKEETTILQYEMDWTVRFFQKQAEIWQGRKGKLEEFAAGRRGPVCYALRQAVMWKIFAERASSTFSKLL